VNRRRSCNHKVPRSRARFTVVLRASTCPRVSAASSNERLGFRRGVGGQALRPAGHYPGPSFSAATIGKLRCQGTKSASDTLGVRQSNYRFERSMMAAMTIKAVDSDCRFGAALRVWHSAQPGR